MLLRLWKGRRKGEERLKSGYGKHVLMQEYPNLEIGRAMELNWGGEGLFSTMPAEIEGLSALIDLSQDSLSGELPLELGNLMSLAYLSWTWVLSVAR